MDLVTNRLAHHVVIRGPPVLAWYPCLAAEKPVFASLLANYIVYLHSSRYSQLIMVLMNDGVIWQPCGDNHALKVASRFDKWLTNHMHDIKASLHGLSVSTKSGLVRRYNQTPVAKASRKLSSWYPLVWFSSQVHLFGCVTLIRHYRGSLIASNQTWIFYVQIDD